MRYRLILCDTSGTHAPIARFESDTPFPTVQVGERFDDTGWPRLDGEEPRGTQAEPVRYTVHSVKHTVDRDGPGLVYGYHVNLQPYNGPKSPVWDD